MKKIILIFAAISLLMAGCKSDEPNNPVQSECEKSRTGTIIFDSWASNPYDCYIDNTYKGRVAANGKLTVNSVQAGYHAFRMTQASGYLLYPSVYTSSGTLQQCGSFTIVFP
ncbi:MAG: hypothetical protein FWF72_01755 [Paludibacter sp.]|nr:hypothetical protein [Paludibacter sp.]